MLLSCQGADDLHKVHYTDLFKTKDHKKLERDRKDGSKLPPKDSNRVLNSVSKMDISRPFDEKEIQSHIKPGNSNRDKLVPLLKSRRKNEENVNGAMYLGVSLRKTVPGVGHSLLMFAERERSRAQETQRNMDKVNSKSHYDHSQWKKDQERLKKAEGHMPDHSTKRKTTDDKYKEKVTKKHAYRDQLQKSDPDRFYHRNQRSRYH